MTIKLSDWLSVAIAAAVCITIYLWTSSIFLSELKYYSEADLCAKIRVTEDFYRCELSGKSIMSSRHEVNIAGSSGLLVYYFDRCGQITHSN
jgi:hypothetical protein